MNRHVIVVALVIALPVPAHAQLILDTFVGSGTGDRFGSGLDAAADQDGDGMLDLVVGAKGHDRIVLLSLADGSTIAEATMEPGCEFGTHAFAVGDVDMDGTVDIVASAPELTVGGEYGVGRVFILSGGDLHVLDSNSWLALPEEGFGSSCGPVGDLDLDGSPDYGAGSACGASPFGGCPGDGFGFLFAVGETSPISWSFDQPHGFRAARDVNADGAPDYVAVHDVLDEPMAVLQAGPVVDGKYPSTLDSFPGLAAGPAGDFDGDGVHEYVLVLSEPAGGSTILVRSGLPPHTVLTLPLTDSPSAIGEVDARGDIDGDGVPDVLVGLPGTHGQEGIYSGRVEAWSGATGAQLFSLAGIQANEGFGTRVVTLGDIDGDGASEFAASAPGHKGYGHSITGRVVVASGKTIPWYYLGQALAGQAGLPSLAGDGPLTAGSPVVLTLTHSAPMVHTVLVTGATQLNQPFKGGVFVPSPDVIVAGLWTDAAGTLILQTAVPDSPPVGLTLHVQAWIADPSGPQGWAASNALAATLH